MTSEHSANIAAVRCVSRVTRIRMEEQAHKLLEEGIRKKVKSTGRGELSTFPDGTKVKTITKRFSPISRIGLKSASKKANATIC